MRDRYVIRILLVEDNPDDADLLLLMLRAASNVQFEITQAETLGECLDALSGPIAAKKFDLVLLDLSLPDSIGVDTLRQVLARCHGIPVVLLTGLDDEALGIEALYAGAQDYLVKGQVDNATLMRAIRYAIERQRIEDYRDDLLAVVSHELRTPLHHIIGNASILRGELVGPLNDRQMHHLERLEVGATRMQELVEDLLDNARLRIGRLELAAAEVFYSDLIEEAIGMAQARADQAGIVLESRVDVPNQVNIDARRVLQVLSNLIGNAIKFSQRGGRIMIDARLRPDALITEVSDTGEGLGPEVASRVFDRFYQADMTSTRMAGGVGLGLSISKAVVEAHGGAIGVRSKPGHGSTFWFSLPHR